MAIVTRLRAQGRPSSSEISTSQTCVVRPQWRRRPTARALPWLIGRMKLVLFDRPMAVFPSPATDTTAAIVAIDSAIVA
jgi:hypothetical protein